MDYAGTAGDCLHLSVVVNDVLAIRILPMDLPKSVMD
jgi:hypothetical protein